MKFSPKPFDRPNFCLRRSLVSCLLVAVLFVLSLPLAACSNETGSVQSVADYGTYGSALAEKLASDYPFRSPGSAQETAAGDYLIKCFKDLGYQAVATEFSYSDAGGSHKSRNIAVKISGSGFVKTSESGNTENVDKQVIIGAHYDTAVTEADAANAAKTTETTAAGLSLAGEIAEPTLADYDGIHDNASGIGALMTIAKEMKSAHLGYDVILVAFGAGEADQAGARFFAGQMSKTDIAATDAMYCMDSIYAGDKMYAHAGRNSLKENYQKDYEKRRKLYEATDVFYDFELYTHNNYMLYTNQASIDVPFEGFANPVLYREWTKNQSDYVPFDDLGIPIVFFESFNYDEKTLESMQESKNPAFGATNGQIRKTRFDSSAFLDQILNSIRSTAQTAESTDAAATTEAGTADGANESTTGTAANKTSIDQLTKRINNTAFIILEAVRKGMAGATAR